MKGTTFEILMPEVTSEKLVHLEDAIILAGSLFRKSREECMLLYSSSSNNLNLNIAGESIQIQREELEKNIAESFGKKSSRLLLIPFKQNLKRHVKPIFTPEHNIIFDSSFPVLTYKNILPVNTIKNIVVPIALNEDFMPLVMKILKFIKTFKSATLHIVSVLQNSNDYTLNKATQQLSFLNQLFKENDIKYTAEIINSQKETELKSDIVLDHINRVNADLVVLYKNLSKENQLVTAKENLFEIIAKSEVPIITFI